MAKPDCAPDRPGVGYEVTFTRTFDAPRRLVFAAWTDPQHLAKWWGPHGFTNPVCRFDARPGGKIAIDMRGPDGMVYPMSGEVREIVPVERLVLVCSALGGGGTPLFEVLTTVTFTEDRAAQGPRTTMRMVARVTGVSSPNAEEFINGMETGWTQSLERLGELIAQA
jgi:uncharacterized protein YndB with AHSA1/START domain